MDMVRQSMIRLGPDKKGILQKAQPGQSTTRQYLVSVGSPGQEPSLLLQARALILVPLPHEVEHLAQLPHFCHWLTRMLKVRKKRGLKC